MTRTGSTQGASRVGALAVVVSAGASPFLAQTLTAIASQTCAPDVVLVVDVVLVGISEGVGAVHELGVGGEAEAGRGGAGLGHLEGLG